MYTLSFITGCLRYSSRNMYAALVTRSIYPDRSEIKKALSSLCALRKMSSFRRVRRSRDAMAEERGEVVVLPERTSRACTEMSCSAYACIENTTLTSPLGRQYCARRKTSCDREGFVPPADLSIAYKLTRVSAGLVPCGACIKRGAAASCSALPTKRRKPK